MNTYDKLKRVVNEFVAALKEGVCLVHLSLEDKWLGSLEQKRFLTYIGKEPSIECDPETGYKYVLKCYDHLLEEEIIFRMKDVKMYKRDITGHLEKYKAGHDKLIEGVSKLGDDKLEELYIRLCLRVDYNDVTRDHVIDAIAKAYITNQQLVPPVTGNEYWVYIISRRMDEGHYGAGDEGRQLYKQIIEFYRDKALVLLEQERILAQNDNDVEGIEEIKIITDMVTSCIDEIDLSF